MVPAGFTDPAPYPGAPSIGPLPAHCRVDGVINRRKGIGGEEFCISFALALPDKAAWNGDFMMQGGGGGNGYVAYPAGASYAGDKPALSRGFAVDSTDTGHKAKTGAFDFSFMRDQQAYLNFAFLANAEVAGIAKQIIARYYAKPAGYSYFVGCSTGGREGMILSQRSHSQLRLPGQPPHVVERCGSSSASQLPIFSCALHQHSPTVPHDSASWTLPQLPCTQPTGDPYARLQKQ